MAAEILRLSSNDANKSAIGRAVDVAARGGLVVFPTETVYGIGARGDDPAAMQRLRELKGRDSEKAFTVHIGAPEHLSRFVSNAPAAADRLTKKLWPGPLTLVILIPDPLETPISRELGSVVVPNLYYDNSIGLRCPDHPFALPFLRDLNHPFVASSANRSCEPAPVDAEAAMKTFADSVDLIVDFGRTTYAKASTIVRITDGGCEVLREGVYDARTVRRMATLRILFVCSGNTCRSPMAMGIARKMLAERLGCHPDELVAREIAVSSAGTSGGFGGAAENAIAVMQKRGIDISEHTSSALNADMVQQADHVFVMTRTHREAVLRMVPRAEERVKLVLNEEDVTDPFGGSEADYEACASVLEAGLAERIREVRT